MKSKEIGRRKVSFNSLALGAKYYGPSSGRLCTKSGSDSGVRQHDGKRGTGLAGTTVEVPTGRNRSVELKSIKTGRCFVTTNADPQKRFLCIKTAHDSYRVSDGSLVYLEYNEKVEPVKAHVHYKR